MGRKVFGVPSSLAGLVIGKGGSIIKEIQEKNGVSFNFVSNDSSVIVMEGSESGIQQTRNKIESIIGFPILDQGDVMETCSINVPDEKLGKVIGQGGSTIQRLSSTHKCSVKVLKTPEEKKKALGSVIIQGKNSQCAAVKKEIESLTGLSLSFSKIEKEEIKDPLNILQLEKQPPIYESIFFPDDANGTGFNRFLLYLQSSQKKMDICVFSITDDRISNVLVAAVKRGVTVRVLTDDDQSKTLGSDIATLKNAGCQVLMDNSPSHLHHKFAILDGSVLINGSFNWTRNASAANHENVMITNDAFFISKYEKHFVELWSKFGK
eukprot:c18583_g1_i1.p1 GENE.c18583_g1_i1~~c18583_g1_i1.p1  ORF type:complete len:322 (+),score=147.58 c18583_g1_i1:59-1024(+)